MANYRMYLDESGNHVFSSSDAVDKRYLCILGLIISEEEIQTKLIPYIRELKDIIRKDPDEVIILHREEIANRRGAVYGRLKDAELESKWNEQIAKIINDIDYTLCAAVLDKKFHYDRYGSAAMNPYHYCLHLLLERYVKFLEKTGNDHNGDVMAEARGGAEDGALKSEYAIVYQNGTQFVNNVRFQSRLTSKDIKITQKEKGIAGLELADLLVLATKLDVLHENRHIDRINSMFIRGLVGSIKPKYDCSPTGIIQGYGRKFIGEQK